MSPVTGKSAGKPRGETESTRHSQEGDIVSKLMRADIEGEAGCLAAARGAGEYNLPAVGRDRQANLAEPQRCRLNGKTLGTTNEKTSPLIRRDGVEAQRCPTGLCGDSNRASIEGAVESSEHPLRHATRSNIWSSSRASGQSLPQCSSAKCSIELLTTANKSEAMLV
jgi:hypothetical protein